MKKVILILLFLTGCSKYYGVIKYEREAVPYYVCRESQFLNSTDIYVCQTADECNKYCALERAKK